MQPLLTTYSMWNLFRNCRKACEWRYVRELVPLKRDHKLSFGSLSHECLEMWHRDRDLNRVLDHIDQALPNRLQDGREKEDWHLATAMMTAYAQKYSTEEFEVVALEKTFQGKILNPNTGSSSRRFLLAGKVDGIMRKGNEYYLLEHKTASQIDGGYLEKLWTDFQITLYSLYIEQCLGIRIAGVVYNVLVKAKLVQGKGETESEFQTRRAKLLTQSKTGRTSATRKRPESDEDFQERLLAKYSEPGMLHREILYISRDQYRVVQRDLWELTQQFLDCRRRNVFYRNTGFCFNYHHPCAYYPLCRSNGSSNVIENFYEKCPPHEELRTDGLIETEKEIF